MDELYTQNTYEGRPHFECTRCPFDTFDEDKMDHHQDTKHPDASTTPVRPGAPKPAGGPGSGAVSTLPTTSAGGGFASPRPEPERGREEKGR